MIAQKCISLQTLYSFLNYSSHQQNIYKHANYLYKQMLNPKIFIQIPEIDLLVRGEALEGA